MQQHAQARHGFINYHDWPWRYALYYGRILFWGGISMAVVDTFLSGRFLGGVVDYASTGQSSGLRSAIVMFGGALFAGMIYIIAQLALFMTSGHAETISASRSDASMLGPRAKKLVNAKIAIFFTYYEMYLSLFSATYMVSTDLIGILLWLWSGGVPDGWGQRAAGLIVALVIVSITFFGAYKCVPKGMSVIEYARHEQWRERVEEEASHQAAKKGGYDISRVTSVSPQSSGSAPRGTGRGTMPALSAPWGNQTQVVNNRKMIAPASLAHTGKPGWYPNDDEDDT